MDQLEHIVAVHLGVLGAQIFADPDDAELRVLTDQERGFTVEDDLPSLLGALG